MRHSTLWCVTSTDLPEQPPWGKFIQERRERQGRSARQAALMADLSDAYWGQVEKGYVMVRGTARPVVPSRRALLAIADSLRMTSKETSHLLELAGHKGYIAGESSAPREAEVNLTGLTRKDVALLNAIADRFREATTVEQEAVEPTPLRRVARGKATTPDPAREAAAERAAREAARRNKDRPK